MLIHTQAHTHKLIFTSKHWEMNMIRKANSFVSLLRYHHFFFSFHIHKKITSERACRWNWGEESWGIGVRGSDGAKMKTGDYWSTGNTGWIFDSAYCDVFFIWKHIMLYWCVKNTQSRGSTQVQRIITRLNITAILNVPVRQESLVGSGWKSFSSDKDLS